jgi:hypothetical protein
MVAAKYSDWLLRLLALGLIALAVTAWRTVAEIYKIRNSQKQAGTRPARLTATETRTATPQKGAARGGLSADLSPPTIRIMGLDPESFIAVPVGHEWVESEDDNAKDRGTLSFDCLNCSAVFTITHRGGSWMASYQYTRDSCGEEPRT